MNLFFCCSAIKSNLDLIKNPFDMNHTLITATDDYNCTPFSFLRRTRRPLPLEQSKRVQCRRQRAQVQAEEGPGAPATGGAMSRVRRPGLGLPLQRTDLRGLQGLLPAQRDEERGVLLQVRARVRDGHVHAAQVPGVPAEEVLGRGHAARVRGAGEPVRDEAQGEEGAEGEGQSADTSAGRRAAAVAEPTAAARVQHVRLQGGLSAGADEVRAAAASTDGREAAPAREADAGEQGAQHSSVDHEPDVGHLQTDLVPGRVRAAE